MKGGHGREIISEQDTGAGSLVRAQEEGFSHLQMQKNQATCQRVILVPAMDFNLLVQSFIQQKIFLNQTYVNDGVSVSDYNEHL